MGIAFLGLGGKGSAMAKIWYRPDATATAKLFIVAAGAATDIDDAPTLLEALTETIAEEGDELDWSGIGRTIAKNAGL